MRPSYRVTWFPLFEGIRSHIEDSVPYPKSLVYRLDSLLSLSHISLGILLSQYARQEGFRRGERW